MAEPTAAEIMPKAIVRERLPAAPTTSAEIMAKKIVQKVDEGAWRAGLEIAKGAPEESKTSEKLEQIGVERDPPTGVKNRTPEEQARYDEARTAANLAKKFLEKGYDGMDPGEQTVLQNAVFAKSSLSPLIAAELAGLTVSEQVKYTERMLKDPKISAEVRKIFEELLDPEKNKLLSLNSAEDAKEKAERDLEDANAEKADGKRIWDMNDKRLSQYEERKLSAGGRPQKGEKLKQMEEIAKNAQSTQKTLDQSRSRLGMAQKDVQRLRDELDQIRRQASSGLQMTGGRNAQTVEQELKVVTLTETTTEQEVAKLEGKLKGLDETKQKIEDDQQHLIEGQKKLDKEKRDIERKVKDAETELRKRGQDLIDRKVVRAAEEQDLVDGFKNIFLEATGGLINQQITEFTTKADAELEERAKQTADQSEKSMYDALQKRWIRRGDSRRRIDRARVDRDFATLVNDGPERLMKILLERSIKDPVNNLTYADSEIEELLSNKEYVEKMKPEVIKRLLAKKVLSGGLRTEDIDIISSSQWGRESINKALDLNEEFRKNIDDVMGEDAIQKHDFFERFGQEFKKHPWWLALFIFPGIAVLGARAAAMSPTEENIST